MAGWKRNPWTFAAALAAAFLFSLLAAWSPAGRAVDLAAYDALLRLNPPAPGPPQSSAVILAIDEASLQAVGGILELRRPLAQALATLAQHEPAAVAVDIVLSEARTPEENAPLEQALEQLPRVTLAANLRTDASGWEKPLPELQQAVSVLGHVHAEPDADGVCRRILLSKAAGRERLWALAFEAYRLASGAPALVETGDAVQLGSVEIPIPAPERPELLIRFAPNDAPIEILPLARVLDDPASAAVVRDRVVFVGVRVLGGLDRYLMTPYSYGEPMPGVEINANVYQTLARGDFLTLARPTTSVLLALAFAAAIGFVFYRLSGRTALWTGFGLLALAHLAPAAAFRTSVVLPAAETLFPAWGAFAVASALHYLVLRGRLDDAEAQRTRYQRAVHYVTHEMRTPLTAIQGSSELISRYSLPEEKQRAIGDLIHKESQRLARMVDMFLSVERLSSGQLELHRESVAPDTLLAECIERIRPVADRKRIEIRQISANAPAIWGDRDFLEYACYNLISNAVKYSPAQTAITVRAWPEKGHVLVSVEDQGYGMDASDLKKIFQKFYRAKTAKQSGEQGTGIGLAIVEEIVVQHGGSIAVESEVGRGSRFTLTLPSAQAPASSSLGGAQSERA
ncbi:MAG: CHASE2 domain-containing protein [Bryobacterales bacterium]|nr:CHASE2 domain-containing protein [Acidobacteriota bacterium]MCB9385756.1 CHASE2 domain-containing protein [Bryobacterales bacterium]